MSGDQSGSPSTTRALVVMCGPVTWAWVRGLPRLQSGAAAVTQDQNDKPSITHTHWPCTLAGSREGGGGLMAAAAWTSGG